MSFTATVEPVPNIMISDDARHLHTVPGPSRAIVTSPSKTAHTTDRTSSSVPLKTTSTLPRLGANVALVTRTLLTQTEAEHVRPPYPAAHSWHVGCAQPMLQLHFPAAVHGPLSLHVVKEQNNEHLSP